LFDDLEKKPASKRASLSKVTDYALTFRKDWVRLSSGRYDMKRLKEAMLLLIASDAPLGPEWRNHSLKGDWADYQECHIGGDFLSIYFLIAGDIEPVAAGEAGNPYVDTDCCCRFRQWRIHFPVSNAIMRKMPMSSARSIF
jgi:mRNA interferase YafQ